VPLAEYDHPANIEWGGFALTNLGDGVLALAFIGAGTETGTDTGIGTATPPGTDTGAGTETGTDSATSTEAGGATSSATGAPSETPPGTDTGTGTATATGTETASETGGGYDPTKYYCVNTAVYDDPGCMQFIFDMTECLSEITRYCSIQEGETCVYSEDWSSEPCLARLAGSYDAEIMTVLSGPYDDSACGGNC